MPEGFTRGRDPNWRRMFAIMSKFPLTDDEHREFIGMLIGREIRTRKELSPSEVCLVVAGYEGYLLMAAHMRDIRGSSRTFTEPDSRTDDPTCEGSTDPNGGRAGS